MKHSLILLFLSVMPLQAQTNLQRRAHAPVKYILAPGDQFTLHVDDLEDISDKPVRVDPEGYVDLPLAGRMQASGLSLDEFKTRLSARLVKYINTPQIAMNLVESGNQPVSVIGQVSNPGVHQISGERRLLDVISVSGGLKPDAGPKLILTREPRWGAIEAGNVKVDPITGYSTATFSLDSLMSSKNPVDNIQIEPNDVISIPRADLVYVVGDVRRAGGFPLSTHETIPVLQALTLAEGLGPDHSAKHAHILRPAIGGDGEAQDIPVDMEKILAGKAPDVPMFANDILFIPHSGVKVTTRRALEAAIGVTTGLLVYRH